MKSLQLEFRLKFGTRHDADANVHVGYCPLLKIYSQGRTEEEASSAVVSAAQLFIISCYERDILHRVLRERGMTRASAKATRAEQEFITVADLSDFDRTFEETVPIELLSARSQQEELACR